MIRQRFKSFIPIVLFFIISSAFFISGKNLLQRMDADQDVLLIGNTLLFIITFISFFLAQRGLKNPNPHGFVRSVYASIMLKLFVCMIAAFVYIASYKSNLNKPALFTCMGLYLLYTFMEVSVIMKLLKQKTNG